MYAYICHRNVFFAIIDFEQIKADLKAIRERLDRPARVLER